MSCNTNTIGMKNKEQIILNLLMEYDQLPSSKIADITQIPLRTTQRELNELKEKHYIKVEGVGRATTNSLTTLGMMNTELGAKLISEKRLEDMYIRRFNEEVFSSFRDFDIFQDIQSKLNLYAMRYQVKVKQSTPSLIKRELERLIIEFSWKSSQIEGNTYSLLETEELLLNNINDPSKHTSGETQMILNHKKALEFIYAEPQYFQNITTKKIIELHTILTENMDINPGFRKAGVGITGSLFKPLDNFHSIQEMMDRTCELINRKSMFEKAFLASLLISYIQPFEDGNKRTSRILSNALLYAFNLPMLSFRSVKVEEYKTAILAFYEFNSIGLYKKIYVNQIGYFVENYF
jgi:Fic family protein